MAQVFVLRAFLSPVIRVICDRLASTDFRVNFHDVFKLEITLKSINKVLDDAEKKQYHNLDVKNWLDHVSDEVYKLEQLLDVIATDAAQQKGKIQRFLSASINRFKSRIKVLLKRLEFLAKEKLGFGLRELTNYYYEDGARDFATSSFMTESIIYGREREKEEIIEFLLSDSYDDELSVISIVGLMGMGKTTLAQLVYNDRRIQEQFEFKAWVHVPEFRDHFHLIEYIFESISLAAGKKYLLVLDDAWIKNRNILEHLLLLFNQGSLRAKMIVTTNDKEVASVMRSTQIIHLRQLEESDSWSLFVRYAFDGRNMFEYPNLESIGKKIVEKCGGLPLALKTLGILLQRKFSETEWVKILETDLWRLYKGYLSLPSNLKHCFAYCSIFPKGYEFEKDGLIMLWMAQGLLKGIAKNEEELGNIFFNDLVSMSFFQQSAIMPFWAGKYYFIMHDLVNDLATSMSGEFCLRIEGVKVQDISQRTRHIWCCLDLEDGDRKLKQIHNIKGLQSLMVEAQGYGEKRIHQCAAEFVFKTKIFADVVFLWLQSLRAS